MFAATKVVYCLRAKGKWRGLNAAAFSEEKETPEEAKLDQQFTQKLLDDGRMDVVEEVWLLELTWEQGEKFPTIKRMELLDKWKM